jgi:hypothetical protein
MLEHSFYLPDNPGFSKKDIVKKIVYLYERNPDIISNRLIDLLSRNETMLRGLLDTIQGLKIRSITLDGKVNIFTDRKKPGNSVHAIYSLLNVNEDVLRKIANDAAYEEKD